MSGKNIKEYEKMIQDIESGKLKPGYDYATKTNGANIGRIASTSTAVAAGRIAGGILGSIGVSLATAAAYEGITKAVYESNIKKGKGFVDDYFDTLTMKSVVRYKK